MLSRRKFLETTFLATAVLPVAFPLRETDRLDVDVKRPFRIALNTSTIRTYKLPVERQVALCGAAGYDGIELWMSDIRDYLSRGEKLADLARKIKDNRLVLENIIGFAQWSADDEEKRKKGVLQLREEMEITAAIGGKYIAAPVMGVGRLDPVRFDEYAQRYAEILEAGKSTGVMPLLELWGGGVLNKLADAAHIALATGSSDANLLLDFFHLYKGGNSFDGLALLNVARMPVFHINDYTDGIPRAQIKDSERVYPGDGVCPFDKVIPALRKGGFCGAFSIELFNEGYCRGNTAEQVLATALEKTRKTIDRSLKA